MFQDRLAKEVGVIEDAAGGRRPEWDQLPEWVGGDSMEDAPTLQKPLTEVQHRA